MVLTRKARPGKNTLHICKYKKEKVSRAYQTTHNALCKKRKGLFVNLKVVIKVNGACIKTLQCAVGREECEKWRKEQIGKLIAT